MFLESWGADEESQAEKDKEIQWRKIIGSPITIIPSKNGQRGMGFWEHSSGGIFTAELESDGAIYSTVKTYDAEFIEHLAKTLFMINSSRAF